MTETIHIWSGEAELYADVRPAPPAILLDICTQLIHTPHPTLVVDLGSGTGLSTVFWAKRAQRVIGIEPNADMRSQAMQRAAAFPHTEQVQYRDGLSTQTGLPSESADMVTCSQSLHWMEPEPTFVEVTRILRPGGLFAAYDYDWPPTVCWEVEQVYHEVIARFRKIRAEREFDRGVKSWSKDKHLTRMQDGGRFRYMKELVVHHMEKGNAERYIGLTLSYGIARYLKQGYLTEQEVGLDHLKRVAQNLIGLEPIPWYFSYRVRIGITGEAQQTYNKARQLKGDRISGSYDGAGCYAIADSGKKYREMNKDAPEPTQECLLHQVNAAMAEGMSLQEVLRAIDGPRVADWFCGYCFEDDYRDVVGLCTGRRAIPL